MSEQSIRELIDQALEEVRMSEVGHLSLQTRGRFWAELGPRVDAVAGEGLLQTIAEGHRRRLRLLSLVATNVIAPAWDDEVVRWTAQFARDRGPLCREEDGPPSIVSLAMSERATTNEVANRSSRYATFRQYAYELWEDAPRAVLCIEFAAGMLSVRARDMVVREDDFEEGNDRWKPDVYACWAYAGSIHLFAESREVPPDEVAARREFWRWYVSVAVPRAAGLEPVGPVHLPRRRWPTS